MKQVKVDREWLIGALVDCFGSWVGTESQELLEDGGTVADHLADYLTIQYNLTQKNARQVLRRFSDQCWAEAWDRFEAEVEK